LAEAIQDPEFHQELLEGLEPLRLKAGATLEDDTVFEALREGQVQGIVKEAAAALLDRLGQES